MDTAGEPEREISLGAPPDLRLPALRVPIGWTAVDCGRRLLHARYLDTPDLALSRRHHALRYRGTGGEAGTWTLKGATVARDGVEERPEFEVDAADGAVPSALLDRLPSEVRAAQLATVARLRTARHTYDIRDSAGTRRVELVDDRCEVLDEIGTVVDDFREFEVEFFRSEDAAVAREIVSQLRAAGATLPPPASKLVRALEVLHRW